MKKNIVILGSTGSIGQMTLDIINNDKKKFCVKLLSANKNINKLVSQAKKFNVKNVIVNDHKKFLTAKLKYKHTNINFYNSFAEIDKLFSKKDIFYTMISVVGINGLLPSLKMIKFTKNIAIVNKESLICGWLLLKKKLIKYKTNFIPIDSEHFSINALIKNDKNKINQIFLTASGGPFINYSLKELKKITINEALKHPNWKMGKKISIDSSTLMNKVFEVIEAKNIFNLNYKQIFILTHPKSYVHAIVKFNNGISKMLMHEPDMKIPIHNSIYFDNKKSLNSKKLNLEILNNLKFNVVDKKKFPLVSLIKNIPQYNSLYETALLSINDYFVEKFLRKKINYLELINNINKFSNNKIFTKYKKKLANNLNDILNLNEYVYLKLDQLCV